MEFDIIKNLKYSRVFFDKRPPNFMYILVYGIAIFLLISLIILNFLNKNYIVNGSGLVVPSDREYISLISDGYVSNMNYEEGSYVKEGEIILSIYSGPQSEQIEAMNEQIEYYNSKIAIFDLYELSLNDKRNYMENSGAEQEFYAQVEYYLSQVEMENEESFNNFNENKESNDTISENNIKISELKIENVSMLSDVEEHNIELSKVNKRLTEIERTLINISELSENEIKELEIEQYDLSNQTTSIDKEISDLNNTINQNENEILNLENENTSLMEKIEESGDSINQSETTYQQLILQLGEKRVTNTETILQLEFELKQILSQSDENNVIAPMSGYIHYTDNIKIGSFVRVGVPLIEISTNNKEHYQIEGYISASDINKIKIADNVKVFVDGVNDTKYGHISGSLVSISNGTISNDQRELFYTVIIEIDEYKLNSNDDYVELQQSMPVQIKIIYNQETYLEWICDKLNFTS